MTAITAPALDAYAETRFFLDSLDPKATSFTFLTRDDRLREDGKPRGDFSLLRQMHGTFDDLRPTLIELNSRGAGIFVAVNRTDLKGRRKHNILAPRGLWHDQDTANVEPMLPQEVPPSLIVETSPGKKQRLWTVSDGLPLEDCSACMRTMVEKHHSDPNAALLTQVLRLPGFFHNKREPHLVRLIGGLDVSLGFSHPYSPAALLQNFPPTPKLTPARGAQREPGTDWDAERVRAALKHVPVTVPAKADDSESADYMYWLRIGMALHHGSNGADGGLELWHEWSEQQADKYEAAVLDDKWHGFRSTGDANVTLGTLFHLAKAGGWTPPPMAVPFSEVASYEGNSAPAPGSSSSTPSWKDRVFSAAALEQRQFAPIRWVLPGLMPEGLTLLAGRPKLGKSWLALDIAVAVATGGSCLGASAVTSGDVLYLALEDNPRRLQRRMRKVCPAGKPPNLLLATEWPRVDKGGIADMAGWFDNVSRPALIICDTLAKVKPLTRTKGYDEDYQALSDLQKFSGERGIPVLVLHHDRKMAADDPIDRVSGTLGLTGAADTIVCIERTNKGVTFYVRGRDVEETERAIEFDPAACRWKMLGDAADVQRARGRKLILGALQVHGRAGPKVLAEITGISNDYVKQLLRQMMEDGELVRPEAGIYCLPTP